MDVFDLSARLTLDTEAYDAGLDAAGMHALTAGAVMSTAFGDAQRQTSDAAAELARNLSMSAQQGGESLASVALAAQDTVSRVLDAFAGLAGSAASWGGDLVDGFVAGLESRMQSLRSAAESLAAAVRSYLHFSEPDVGPLADFHTYAPDMMALFARGIRENEHLVTEQLARSFDFAPTLTAERGALPSASGAENAVPIRTQSAADLDFGERPAAPVFRTARPEESLSVPARQEPGQQTAEAPRELTVILELDRTQLGRAVYQLNKEETQRVGVHLAGGFA